MVGHNPQVGAVITANGRIIGEGWHQKMGGPHAEINALKSVKQEDKALLKKAKIFVSLEPCAHYGKTPPCALSIIEAGIPEVYIAMLDPTDKVAGKGVKIMQKAGVKVHVYDIPAARKIADTFLIRQDVERPKVLLKFAQSADGYISKKEEQTWLTNAFSKRLVHTYRGKIGAILVGRKTVEIDNPSLTTRFGFGANPLRIVIDLNGKLSPDRKIFKASNNGIFQTIILTYGHHPLRKLGLPTTRFVVFNKDLDLYQQLFSFLYKQGINTLLVEGGAQTLLEFIKFDIWDEALVFTSQKLLKHGISAPRLIDPKLLETLMIKEDAVHLYQNKSSK